LLCNNNDSHLQYENKSYYQRSAKLNKKNILHLSVISTLLSYYPLQSIAAELEMKNEYTETLSEIKVNAKVDPNSLPPAYAGGQIANGGRLGLLGNTTLLNAPFSISSYTSEMIENQQAMTAAEVLSKDAGVRSSGQTGGLFDSFFIRGFPIGEGNAGEIAFDGVYGVAPNYRIFTDYAERVEVIKGPAALLYGMSPNSAVGGVINIVPKRAANKDLTRLTTSYATKSQLGGHVDISRRLGEDRQFGVRFNGSIYEGDTPLDNQSREAFVGALALDYSGDRFRASLDLLNQKEDINAPSRPFLVANGVGLPSAPDGQRNVTQKWEYANVHDRSALLKTEFDLTSTTTVFASAGGAHTDVERTFGTPTILNARGDTSSTPGNFIFNIHRTSYDAGIRTQFDSAAITHAVTLQTSLYEDRIDRGSRNGTAVLSNLYSPINQPDQNIASPSTPKLSESKLQGVALADAMSLLNERLLITLGVRKQQVESKNFSTNGAVTSAYKDDALTPLAGIVIKPWQHVAFYGNYIEGLSRGDIAPLTATNAGQSFAPYKTKQREVGVKIDHGRFISTLSVFQIEKPSGQLTNGVFAVDAEQRNRGLEFNIIGEVTPGVRLLSGATFFDAELTKTNNVATRGKTPIGVPSSQANLGLEWDTSWVPGLTVNGAITFTDKQYVNQANTQELASWTRFDLGARYTTAITGHATTLRANVLNVFDRDYWSGVASYSGVSIGAPRTLMLSATVDF